MSNNESRALSPQEYLNSFDCHSHTFAHCVFRESGEPDWNDVGTPLEYELHFIARRMRENLQLSAQKGVRYLFFTEHPQFLRYDVPFTRYLNVFRGIKSRFQRDFIRIGMGIEIDVLRDASNRFRIEEEVLTDSEGTPTAEIMRHLDLILIGFHNNRHNKDASRRLRNNDDFLNVLINSCAAARDFENRMYQTTGTHRTLILAHPWQAAIYANTDYLTGELGDACVPELPAERVRMIQQRLDRGTLPIARFTPLQLQELVEALDTYGVIPELNLDSVRRGLSDLSYTPYDGSILQAYLRHMITAHPDRQALTSIACDLHVPLDDTLRGKLTDTLDFVLHHVPELARAKVWCDENLRHGLSHVM